MTDSSSSNGPHLSDTARGIARTVASGSTAALECSFRTNAGGSGRSAFRVLMLAKSKIMCTACYDRAIAPKVEALRAEYAQQGVEIEITDGRELFKRGRRAK